MSHADTHVLGFQSFVSNQVVEAVLLVVAKRLRTVQRINDEESATRAVVGAEEHLDEVHDGGAETLPGEVATGAETADEDGGEALQGLVAQVGVIEELLLVLVGDAVRQADAVIGEQKAVTIVSGWSLRQKR